LDWQGGWDSYDRVLGNRRYPVAFSNISNYVNRSATPNEMTVRAVASHHYYTTVGPRTSANGFGLRTDYVAVVTHMNCTRPEPTFTIDDIKNVLIHLRFNSVSGISRQKSPFNSGF
jgi:hypothetical protein